MVKVKGTGLIIQQKIVGTLCCLYFLPAGRQGHLSYGTYLNAMGF